MNSERNILGEHTRPLLCVYTWALFPWDPVQEKGTVLLLGAAQGPGLLTDHRFKLFLFSEFKIGPLCLLSLCFPKD